MTATVRIYRPVPMDGYEWALPVDDSDFETFRLAGEAGKRSWSTPEMRLLRVDDSGQPLSHAAMPWLGSHILVLRDEAIDAVGRLLAGCGELLPLAGDDARLLAFSARPLPGALDAEHSEVVRFGSGRILDLKRPEFHDEIVAGAGAFKLPEMPRGDIYLTQEMVDAIRATGHSSGTGFTLVYDAGGADR